MADIEENKRLVRRVPKDIATKQNIVLRDELLASQTGLTRQGQVNHHLVVVSNCVGLRECGSRCDRTTIPVVIVTSQNAE